MRDGPNQKGKPRKLAGANAPQVRPSLSPVAVYLSKWPAGSDSRKTMAAALDSLACAMGGKDAESYPWHRLRYDSVRGIPAKLAEAGKAPRTINKCLSALRGILEAAWRLGLLPGAEYRKIGRIQSVRGSRLPAGRALEPADLAALTRALGAASPRDAALVAFLLVFGLRRIEAVRLRREHYDPADGLRAHGKEDKERLVPVAPEWRAVIEQWWERLPPRSPMFPDADGKPINRRQVGYIVERFCKTAGCRRFTPHDLRRTFATTLLNSGVDLLTVRDLMGHQSVATTGIYDRRGEAAKRAAVGAIRKPGTVQNEEKQK